MFDIGFLELLVIAVLSLLIMGPERLPGAVRNASLWIARLRHSLQQIKSEIESEIGADELKQQLHNERVLSQLSDTRHELQHEADKFKRDLERLPYDVSDVVDQPSPPDSHTDHSQQTTDRNNHD